MDPQHNNDFDNMQNKIDANYEILQELYDNDDINDHVIKILNENRDYGVFQGNYYYFDVAAMPHELAAHDDDLCGVFDENHPFNVAAMPHELPQNDDENIGVFELPKEVSGRDDDNDGQNELYNDDGNGEQYEPYCDDGNGEQYELHYDDLDDDFIQPYHDDGNGEKDEPYYDDVNDELNEPHYVDVNDEQNDPYDEDLYDDLNKLFYEEDEINLASNEPAEYDDVNVVPCVLAKDCENINNEPNRAYNEDNNDNLPNDQNENASVAHYQVDNEDANVIVINELGPEVQMNILIRPGGVDEEEVRGQLIVAAFGDFNINEFI